MIFIDRRKQSFRLFGGDRDAFDRNHHAELVVVSDCHRTNKDSVTYTRHHVVSRTASAHSHSAIWCNNLFSKPDWHEFRSANRHAGNGHENQNQPNAISVAMVRLDGAWIDADKRETQLMCQR